MVDEKRNQLLVKITRALAVSVPALVLVAGCSHLGSNDAVGNSLSQQSSAEAEAAPEAEAKAAPEAKAEAEAAPEAEAKAAPEAKAEAEAEAEAEAKP